MSTTYIRTSLDDADMVGGKAASLARLRRLGLPVPEAFVVTDELLRALLPSAHAAAADPQTLASVVAHAAFPPAFESQLQQRLATLGASRFSIRSSFALEDDPDALAAGVYESYLDVQAQDVPQAVKDVLSSAFSAAAVTYAQARKRDVMQGPYAVLVHPYVKHRAHGHAALHEPSAPHIWEREGSLQDAQRQQLEQALDQLLATTGACEVEWLTYGKTASETLLFLQWRPYKPPADRQPWQPTSNQVEPHVVSDFLATWTWDAAHNPHPLSPAQQSLVSLVQAQCRVGFDQCTAGGYLFYRPAPERTAPAWPLQDVQAHFAALKRKIEQGLEELGPAPSVPSTLQLFVAHYEALIGSCGAAIRSGRTQLKAWLSQHLPHAVPHLPDLLADVPSAASHRGKLWRQYLEARAPAHKQAAWAQFTQAFGDEAMAWDVMAPTHKETLQPRELAGEVAGERLARTNGVRQHRFAEARERVLGDLPTALHPSFIASLNLARSCAGLAEDDDALYARLQAPIRYALLRLSRAWYQQGVMQDEEDIFFLSLDRVVVAFDSKVAPSASEIALGRELWQRQRHNPPPAAVAGTPNKQPLRGHGTSGRVVGKVLIHQGGPPPQAPDRIVMATTLLPTELPLIAAAAIVTATGGPLDHVAAQARERGLIALVGVADVFEHIREGDTVLVDANAGLVRLLQRS